ncbi:MAG: sugar ABC transporter permease [Roseburia sp.]|nr:sugar ABC transporter permease [Roseburia sp.]
MHFRSNCFFGYKCKERLCMQSKTRKLKKFLKQWQLYLLILPAAVYLLIFNYQPMYGVQIAFRDFSIRDGIWGSEWVGLKYIKQFIEYPNFKLLLGNTLRLGVYTLAVFPCPVIFALMLNEVRNNKLKKSIQMISYMPYFLSTVVVCSLLMIFTDKDAGVINTLIEALGGTRMDFMTEAAWFDDLYVWSAVWKNMGFDAIIYIAALSSVPEELVEAARIDGANRLKIIWHVNIPSILPTIVIMLILASGHILGVGYEKVLLLQNDLNLSASQIISTYVYELGIRGGQFSYSSAIGLFNNVVNVLILWIVNTISKKVSETGLW